MIRPASAGSDSAQKGSARTVAGASTRLRSLARLPAWLLPELAGAATSAGLALACAVFTLRLWRAHPNVPLSAGGDALLSLMVVKNMQTTGWYQGTASLGAPFGQDLTAYPSSVGDTWHMVALKLLSTFLTPAATVNVFFILGFPLIAAVAYGALRLLGVSRPFSCALGAVYAILPYHFLRGESHLLLSAYFAVPVACVLAVSLYNGHLTAWASPRHLPKTAWATLAAAALLAGTGLYYAAFAVVLLAASGVLASLATRSWRPLLAAAPPIVVIGAGLFLSALPNILRVNPLGATSAVQGRSYLATETFGLKITSLILPLGSHRIPALAHLRAIADDTLIPGEGSEAIGILAVVGLVAIVLAVLLPALRAQTAFVRRMRPLGALAIVSLLCGTVAGLNSVLAVFGLGELRAWNRISILLGFLGLAGLGLLLDVLRARWTGGAPLVRGLVTSGIACLVLVVGLYDQTIPMFTPHYAGTAKAWNSDSAYFTQLQNTLGKNASLFTLPYAPFPENPPIVNMKDYEQLRGYLHSDLRWSYGGVKNQESEWQPIALQDGTAAALPRLVAAGFDAVYINRLGYADAGAQVEAEITAVIGRQAPLLNSNGTLATYDLRPYAESLKRSATRLPSRESVLYPVRVACTTGCYDYESSATEQWQWAQKTADLTLINPSSRAATVILRGAVRVATNNATVRVRIGNDEQQLHPTNGLVDISIRTTAKPGMTSFQITTDSPATKSTPNDPRDLRQQLLGLKVVALSDLG